MGAFCFMDLLYPYRLNRIIDEINGNASLLTVLGDGEADLARSILLPSSSL